MDEEMTPLPEDPYGIAKYAVELDLAAAKRLFGLDYIIFRPHNVYGERQNIGDKYRNVIGIIMNQVMRGLPCTIFGDGSQTRAFTHVADVAPVIAGSVDVQAARGQVFNLGADIPYSVLDLARMVQNAMGVYTGCRFLDARKEVLHAYSTHEKAAKLLGCRPAITLEEGLARMATWAWKMGPRSGVDFGEIEVPLGLPEIWESRQCTTA